MELPTNFVLYQNLCFNIVHESHLKHYKDEVVNFDKITKIKCDNEADNRKYVLITKSENDYVFKHSDTKFIIGFDWVKNHRSVRELFDNDVVLDLMNQIKYLVDVVDYYQNENTHLKFIMISK
jgi:hypothetical protein